MYIMLSFNFFSILEDYMVCSTTRCKSVYFERKIIGILKLSSFMKITVGQIYAKSSHCLKRSNLNLLSVMTRPWHSTLIYKKMKTFWKPLMLCHLPITIFSCILQQDECQNYIRMVRFMQSRHIVWNEAV